MTPWGPSSTTARAALTSEVPCRWATRASFDGSARVMDENSRSVSGTWAAYRPRPRDRSCPAGVGARRCRSSNRSRPIGPRAGADGRVVSGLCSAYGEGVGHCVTSGTGRRHGRRSRADPSLRSAGVPTRRVRGRRLLRPVVAETNRRSDRRPPRRCGRRVGGASAPPSREPVAGSAVGRSRAPRLEPPRQPEPARNTCQRPPEELGIPRASGLPGRVHRELRHADVDGRHAESGRGDRSDGRAAGQVAAAHEALDGDARRPRRRSGRARRSRRRWRSAARRSPSPPGHR